MRPIRLCLNNQLLEICQHAIQLDELNTKVKNYLPSSLSTFCQIGSFSKGCLVITTTDAAWATELRYRLPELRDKLRKEAGLYQLISIKVAIVDIKYQAPLVVNKHINLTSLSATARGAIQAAGELCSYPPLKEALYQLAGKTAETA